MADEYIKKKVNYIISDKKKIVYLDYDNASEIERERASFIAKANGYKLKTKLIKPTKKSDGKELAFIIKKLEGVNDQKELEDFFKNNNVNETHITPDGKSKKNGFMYASGIVYANHKEWLNEENTLTEKEVNETLSKYAEMGKIPARKAKKN